MAKPVDTTGALLDDIESVMNAPEPLYPGLRQLVLTTSGNIFTLIGMSDRETIYRQNFEYRSNLYDALDRMLMHMRDE